MGTMHDTGSWGSLEDKRARYDQLKKMEQDGSLDDAGRQELAMLQPDFEE